MLQLTSENEHQLYVIIGCNLIKTDSIIKHPVYEIQIQYTELRRVGKFLYIVP